MSTVTPALQLRNIWKIFGDDVSGFKEQISKTPSLAELDDAGLIAAVRDVTLDISHGEIFVIMGLSGSGKSTLVRCMSRLVEPTAGELMFAGQNLLAASEDELIQIRRHKMGMVFQHFALLPHMSVLDNVAFPLEIQGIDKQTREQRASEMISLVGLSGREEYYPRELSGGQQQRVGIARSLAVEPDIWFLDEPFSALDPLIRREMQDEFLRLQDILKKTIVFITHDFDEAIRLADRIAIMKDGAVIQIGTPEDLIINPATEYVAEFTRDVSRAKVFSARMVMRPLAPDEKGSLGELLKHDVKVQEFADQAVNSEDRIGVTDDAGSIIGVIDRQSVLNVLVGRESAGSY